MNKTFFYDNFWFLDLHFNKYHYTDARKGTPANYLAYMIKGHAKIVSDNMTLHIEEGDVFYIPKGLAYQSYWYGQDEINWLSFGFSHLNTTDDINFKLQKIPCSAETIKKITELPTVGNSVTCKILSCFYDIMADVIPVMKPASSTKGMQIVNRAKNYINTHPYCTIPEIAKDCMISEPYLYSLFKNIDHSTPNEYRQQILCQKGFELLTTTDKTIEEISEILNFSSASYFRKVLKKYTGSTPREIRRDNVF